MGERSVRVLERVSKKIFYEIVLVVGKFPRVTRGTTPSEKTKSETAAAAEVAAAPMKNGRCCCGDI